jgi:N-dimethylarginine dimethylaminohydrolase
MTTTLPPGPDVPPSTYGGPGWIHRTSSHREEVAEGRLWYPARVDSEVSRLEEVLLTWPGEELNFREDPDSWLMLGRPDLGRIRKQCLALRELYESQGVKVHLLEPSSPPPPNLLFLRDLFLVTPEGAILGRPAAFQRSGEERFVAEALARLGVPILATMRGQATFEGADALWLAPDRVLFGLGLRTNQEGLWQVSEILHEMEVWSSVYELPPGVQHLLGVLNFIDGNLAAADAERCPQKLLQYLGKLGIEVVALPPDHELRILRGLNFVTLAPRRIVMPAGCANIRKRLEDKGVLVFEADVSEYLKAAGGIGCLTGILRREVAPVPSSAAGPV